MPRARCARVVPPSLCRWLNANRGVPPRIFDENDTSITELSLLPLLGNAVGSDPQQGVHIAGSIEPVELDVRSIVLQFRISGLWEARQKWLHLTPDSLLLLPGYPLRGRPVTLPTLVAPGDALEAIAALWTVVHDLVVHGWLYARWSFHIPELELDAYLRPSPVGVRARGVE